MSRWHISQKAEFQGDEGRRAHVGDVEADTEQQALAEAERKFGPGVDRKAVERPTGVGPE